MSKIDPHKYPGPLEELEKRQGSSNADNKRTKIAVILEEAPAALVKCAGAFAMAKLTTCSVS